MKKVRRNTAKKLFQAGHTIRVCASNMHPENVWGAYADINKNTVDDFEKFLNGYSYYNCNAETGKNIAFYIKEEMV